MIARVLSVILIVLVLEVWGLMMVGSRIGVWYTLALIFLTSGLGALLATKEGMQTMQLARLQLSRREIPGQAVMDGICILTGGFMLLAPGFFTDGLGFFLLIPYSRSIVKALLLRWLTKWIQLGRFTMIKR